MTTIRNMFGIPSSVPNASHMIGGVELEIEDILGYKDHQQAPWNCVPDGSLRNNGTEFVSPPLDVQSLILGFKGVHASVIHHPITPKPFSERTSIHVHVNCLDLEASSTKSLLLWYAMFEPVFFSMVDPGRKNNIHCVPLDQTHLSSHYKKGLSAILERWSKYTAFNLLPLKTQGTIEFRHMEGHSDPERFEEWLKTIENWWKFGQSCMVTKAVLTDKEQILVAFDEIFKDAPRALKLRSSLFGMLEHSLVDVKLSLV